jgi:hypothetical protein
MSNDSSNSIPWSKLGKREISQFVGHELIYDFITHSLDEERQKAIEDFVLTSKDAQQDMMKMLNGIQYSERLSETVVSELMIAQINEPSSYLAVLLKKTNFQNWPASVKWALEALVVVSVIIAISLAIPWNKVSKFNPFPERKETVLAEIDRNQQIGNPDKLKAIELSEPAEFADEEKKEAGASSEKNKAKVAAENTDEVPATPAPVGDDLSKKTPPPVVTTSLAAAATAVKTATKEATKEAKAAEGAIYRGAIEVTNLEAVGPKIRDKVMELGGRKAGEVELGWQKNPDSAYYHFTLPEAKYEELLEFLENYGTPKIRKEKHQRVMPDGIIRLILTVDEAKK